MLGRIRKAKDEGFTLIELLIVIIILGILAAIVVFAVGQTRGDSVTATCKTDVKSIQLGTEAVKTKTGTYPAVPATGNAYDNILVSKNAAGGAVLKSWPGGTDATADLFFTYAQTPATGTPTGYTLKVQGKNLTAPATAQTLTQDSTDADVAAACASS